MTASSQPRQVKCPTCQTKISWIPEQVFRPFCSERCRLIDLGEWIAEEKVISEPAVIDDTADEMLWQ